MTERSGLAVRRDPHRPEPDLPAVLHRLIETALRWGWNEVWRRWPDVVTSGREEAITKCLCDVLNEHDEDGVRLAPGLEVFETVVRGAKVESVDGRIEKAPDLAFRPYVCVGVRNRSDWGLYVECKIVEGNSGNRSPDEYCSKGVARFADGEYAARVSSGLMIAYVRDARTPFATLDPLLDERFRTVAHVAGDGLDTSRSTHDRMDLPLPCVDVTLLHLWLDARSKVA